MTSCDTNILLYAFNASCPEHARAYTYLRDQQQNESFAICELVLLELYVLLRNPAVVASPLSAKEAVRVVQQFRDNPRWRVIDYPGGLMPAIWRLAAQSHFPRQGILDARLAATLRHHGVREFATRNTAHFRNFGFDRLINPIDPSPR
ncbi:MAG: PIN domain-containing protein [Bryobacterales bacterium]|nr:PIN domain-containing protein [Bryobacterales bacterium]